MRYIAKMVKAGNVVHITTYEKPVGTGEHDLRKKKKEDMPDWIAEIEIAAGREKESEESIQKRAGRRARLKMMDLIRVNAAHDWRDHEGKPCKNKFLTLTFKDNVQDLEWANDQFKKFIQRLNYHVTGEKKAVIKYVVVVEFQKRGAVHYHTLFFNLPYVPHDELEKVWGHGWVSINAIDHVDDLGAYLGKYMIKTMEGTENDKDQKDKKRRRDKGKKRYWASRGLIKPEVIPIKSEKELDSLAAELAPHQVYRYEYDTEYYGRIRYYQYNMIREK